MVARVIRGSIALRLGAVLAAMPDVESYRDLRRTTLTFFLGPFAAERLTCSAISRHCCATPWYALFWYISARDNIATGTSKLTLLFQSQNTKKNSSHIDARWPAAKSWPTSIMRKRPAGGLQPSYSPATRRGGSLPTWRSRRTTLTFFLGPFAAERA